MINVLLVQYNELQIIHVALTEKKLFLGNIFRTN